MQNDDIRLLAEFENTSRRKNVVLRTDYSISEDSTKLLIYATPGVINHVQMQHNPYGKELEENRLFICAFDKDLKMMWQQEASNAISSGVFVFDKFSIDNSANVYIIGQSFIDNNQAENIYCYINENYYNYVQPSNYTNSILFFGNNGKELKQLNVDPLGIFAKSVTICPKDNYLFCSGIYASPGRISAEGAYSCKVNILTGKTEDVHKRKFPKELLDNQVDVEDLRLFRKQSNDFETDPYQYPLSKLEQTPDGGYLFIAEQEISGKLEDRLMNSITIYPTHNYGNLYVTTVSPTGEIGDTYVVSKKQFAFENSSLSYSYILSGDKTYLLFTNIRKITELSFSNKVAKIENTCLIEVDKKGHQTKNIIADFTKFDHKTLFMRTSAALVLPSEKAIIYPIKSEGFKYRTYQKILVK